MQPNRSVQSLLTLVAALLFLAVLGGVGCSSHEPATVERPPANPREVAIYTKEPKKYETLGSVEVPIGGDVRWDANGDATPGFEKLKAVAAARGANGLLLLPGASKVESVVAGYRGTFYQVPLRRGTPNAVVVPAIYVVKP